MKWWGAGICLILITVATSMNACDQLPMGMMKKDASIQSQHWIETGDPALKNPCLNDPGIFPDLMFFDGGLWCSKESNRVLYIAKLARDLKPIELYNIQLSETYSFARLGNYNGQVMIGMYIKNGTRDEVHLRNLATGAMEYLGYGGGMFPTIMGYGLIAWLTSDGASDRIVYVRKIGGGPILSETTFVDSSQGLTRIFPDGTWLLTDQTRNMISWGQRPCWAGDYIFAQNPDDNGLHAQHQGGKVIHFFQGRRAFDARCSEVPGGAAVVVWGPGAGIDMKVLTPSDFQ